MGTEELPPVSSPGVFPGDSGWHNMACGEQTVPSSNGMSWPTDFYTGTGFPKVLYLGYPLYHHTFPITALSKYLSTQKGAVHRELESKE